MRALDVHYVPGEHDLIDEDNGKLITLVAIPTRSGEPGKGAPEAKVIDGYNMIH